MTSLPSAAGLSLPGIVFSTVFSTGFSTLLADDESRQHVSSVVATILPVAPPFASMSIACRVYQATKRVAINRRVGQEEMWGDLRNRGFDCTGSGWEILDCGPPHAMREEEREGDEGAGQRLFTVASIFHAVREAIQR
ncbi:hypothetical protein EV361DRAFT_967237 [Lentinula raphanica]|uniref:Uncharacterized protein n=1 Tax=Lentinula raphanica TaxID=153919 RepID=A0AA38NYU7_9AGAR|nr:hypothetical protein F5878DRAFT_665982 [Lentinula raphanica]KAJ3964674.1 hypothetical protein EV361DRAFT_967237 [Lentinula raphanica]